MANNNISLEIKNVRAIKKANIILDGITVISGVNGSGKSTISKLLYSIVKTSIDYDNIVERKSKEDLQFVYRNLDLLSRELSYFLDKNSYIQIRKSFRKITRSENQLSLFENDNSAIASIELLIEIFEKIPELKNSKNLSFRLERIRRILKDSLKNENTNLNSNVSELLEKLKAVINSSIHSSLKTKEKRPISVLNEILDEVFYDTTIKKTFNLFEYGVPIIDRENNKLTPIHSFQNVAYIDTPMILGLDFITERLHWEDLNDILTNKGISRSQNDFESIFQEDVIKGDVNFEDSEISDRTFVYKRKDGQEFDLLECATGLKSFAILRILYKNGFLNDKSLLIIDEPEAHLHPQWVVEFARLIVLFNKKIGVKFLIGSHHPDIISAIKYISEKEGNSNGLHNYLAREIENSFQYVYEDLGTEIEEIFTSFNIALERIDLYGSTE